MSDSNNFVQIDSSPYKSSALSQNLPDYDDFKTVGFYFDENDDLNS